MRIRARVDANQAEIVTVLRLCGVAVQSLSAIGNGCPDLLVSAYGVNGLLEIKDPAKPPSERRLTPSEAVWHARWQGPVAVAHSFSEAMDAIRAWAKEAGKL